MPSYKKLDSKCNNLVYKSSRSQGFRFSWAAPPREGLVSILVQNSRNVTKKVLVFRIVARSCSLTKKLLKILKVAKKLPSRIWKGLLASIAKQQLCTCITLFCAFLYRERREISRFMEDRNTKTSFRYSLSQLLKTLKQRESYLLIP